MFCWVWVLGLFCHSVRCSVLFCSVWGPGLENPVLLGLDSQSVLCFSARSGILICSASSELLSLFCPVFLGLGMFSPVLLGLDLFCFAAPGYVLSCSFGSEPVLPCSTGPKIPVYSVLFSWTWALGLLSSIGSGISTVSHSEPGFWVYFVLLEHGFWSALLELDS